MIFQPYINIHTIHSICHLYSRDIPLIFHHVDGPCPPKNRPREVKRPLPGVGGVDVPGFGNEPEKVPRGWKGVWDRLRSQEFSRGLLYDLMDYDMCMVL